MADTIAVTFLERMTPPIWSHMRLCRLRGVLAATPAAQEWVLHNPRMWLGRAFHQVMLAAAQPGASACEAEMAWRSAVADAAQAAAEHPLDFRFRCPERWPGYFLVRQRALASATNVKTRARTGYGDKGKFIDGVRGRERRIETRDGRLAGRPDFYDGHTIVEYKSTLPDKSWPGATNVMDEYHRQLHLYAAILADVENRWPVAARIVEASGQVSEFRLVPEKCKAEAEAALQSLEDVNRELRRVTAPAMLASPDSESCSSCPFQALCPAFWMWLKARSPEVVPAAAAMNLIGIDMGQDSDLYMAHVEVASSSLPIDQDQAIVLRRSAHGDLTGSPKGTRWRVVSAVIRADARLRANLSTVVLPEKSVPSFRLVAMSDDVRRTRPAR